jgi:hypothetical protein
VPVCPDLCATLCRKIDAVTFLGHESAVNCLCYAVFALI